MCWGVTPRRQDSARSDPPATGRDADDGHLAIARTPAQRDASSRNVVVSSLKETINCVSSSSKVSLASGMMFRCEEPCPPPARKVSESTSGGSLEMTKSTSSVSNWAWTDLATFSTNELTVSWSLVRWPFSETLAQRAQ